MLLVVIIAGVFICLDLLNWLSWYDNWFLDWFIYWFYRWFYSDDGISLDAVKIELIVAIDVLIKCIQMIFGPDA